MQNETGRSAATGTQEPPVSLHARTARELMTGNPLSIRVMATVDEAADFLFKHKISAAPVVDDAGRPVGVISLSDLVWYQRANSALSTAHEFYRAGEPTVGIQPPARSMGPRQVKDIMTPAVFSVFEEAPLREVVREMYTSRVHRLFVVDHSGTLVGVVSAFDIIRDLSQG